jgi:hypothetical protein
LFDDLCADCLEHADFSDWDGEDEDEDLQSEHD